MVANAQEELRDHMNYCKRVSITNVCKYSTNVKKNILQLWFFY